MKPRHRYWKSSPSAEDNTAVMKNETGGVDEDPYELNEQKLELKCMTQPQMTTTQQCDTPWTTGGHNPGTVPTEIGIKQENVLHEDPYGLTESLCPQIRINQEYFFHKDPYELPEHKMEIKCTCITEPQMTVAQEWDISWSAGGHNSESLCPQMRIKQENLFPKDPYELAQRKTKLKCRHTTKPETTGTQQCHTPLVTGEDNPGNNASQIETSKQIVRNENLCELTEQDVEPRCKCIIQPQVTDSLQCKTLLITGEQSPGRKYPRTENIQQNGLSGRLSEKQHDAINCTGQRRVTSHQKNTTQQYSACTTRSKRQWAQPDLESQCITQLQRKGTEKHDICFNTSEQHSGNTSTQTGNMEKRRLPVRTVETRHRDRLMSQQKKRAQQGNGQRDDFRTPLVQKPDKTIADDGKRNTKGRFRHCDKAFGLVDARVKHEQTHTKEKPYRCTHCSKEFTQLCQKKSHERIHTKEKPYHCTYCPKTFAQAGNKKSHERIHTKEKPHQCTYCPKTFAQACNKKTHERIHTKEKPYECTYCHKPFSHLSCRDSHERIHTKEKPFQCTYCPKTFAHLCSKNAHERIHTKEKPYECAYCPKTFSHLSSKHAHERVHTKEKPYQCTYCPKTFARRDNKKTHERIHTKKKSC